VGGEAMGRRGGQHRLVMLVCWLLVVFLVLFPKGGIKIGTLPLTWGYIFLGLTVPFVASVRLLVFPLKLPVRVLGALAMLFPMQALEVCSYAIYGVADPPFAVSTMVALFLLPAVFLLVYAPFLPLVDGEKLSRYLRWSILLAALWGIFLFFLHPVTGHYIEIPYLTVNAADYGQIELTKHIARGLFFKLISTYNNGNLYGVATLMLFPLYSLLEKARWRRMVVRVALLLTLSRTVWAGLVVYELLPILVQLGRQWRTFPVLHLEQSGRKIAALVVTGLLVLGAVSFNHSGGGGAEFLLDPNLGGRTQEVKAIGELHFLPTFGVGGFGEVVYAAAMQTLGYAGLMAMILWFGSPVLLLALDRSALRSPSRRAALKGLVLYAFLAIVDGGFDYIPVMAFYWFVYMIYLFGWPAFGGQRERRYAVAETGPAVGSLAVG